MMGYERSNDVYFGYMIYGWKALDQWFKYQVVWSFFTESYDCFSGQISAKTAVV
jgi:hypothetical protein